MGYWSLKRQIVYLIQDKGELKKTHYQFFPSNVSQTGGVFWLQNFVILLGLRRFAWFGTIWGNSKRERQPWWSDTLACTFTKSNTTPWVFFTFSKLYKWQQITKSITNILAIFSTGTNILNLNCFFGLILTTLKFWPTKLWSHSHVYIIIWIMW